VVAADEGPRDAAERAVLRLVDNFVSHPIDAGAELYAELAAHFSDSEIMEITLDAAAFSKQKVLVALDLDSPVSATGATALAFDAGGRSVVGAPLHIG
jgi:hypothetical protein